MSRPRTLARLLIVAVAVAAAGLAGCGSGEGQRLSIATGGSGGVYFVYGGGIAEQIGEHLDGYSATAEVTSASVDNMYLIADGKSDLAFALADTAADAVRGTDTFDGEKVPAQALARLYNNLTQVATVRGKGIETIEDLRGKQVSVGSPGSGTEVIALRVLEAAGLDPDHDLQRQQLGVGESVQAVKDGALDAFFWTGGVPTSAVTDLATSRELLLLPPTSTWTSSRNATATSTPPPRSSPTAMRASTPPSRSWPSPTTWSSTAPWTPSWPTS